MAWKLRTLEGNETPLGDGTYVVGRAPDCQVLTPEEDLRTSRRHACLHVRGEQLLAEDLGSANGTYANGMPLDRPVGLRSGDTLRLGDTRLWILWSASAPPAARPARGNGPTAHPTDHSNCPIAQLPNCPQPEPARLTHPPTHPSTHTVFLNVGRLAALLLVGSLFLPWFGVLGLSLSYAALLSALAANAHLLRVDAPLLGYPLVAAGMAAAGWLPARDAANRAWRCGLLAAGGAVGLMGASGLYYQLLTARLLWFNLAGVLSAGFYTFAFASLLALVAGGLGLGTAAIGGRK